MIAASDVDSLRQQMGEPKEFAGGAADNSAEDDAKDEVETDIDAADDGVHEKPTKRLMRDPDQAIIGGVCAGVAAYWGVNPLWVRILFIISPFISFGTSILVYIVMWASMPMARTAAEKLQMRGEAVTLESLRKFSAEVEDKIDHRAVNQVTSVLAKILQVFVASVLFVITLGLLVVLVMGIITGTTVVSLLSGFTAQPWTWGLFGGRFNRCSLAGAHVNFYGVIRPAPASSTFYNSTFPIYDDEADNI